MQNNSALFQLYQAMTTTTGMTATDPDIACTKAALSSSSDFLHVHAVAHAQQKKSEQSEQLK